MQYIKPKFEHKNKSLNKALDKFKETPGKEWKSIKKQEEKRLSGIKDYS